MQEEISEGVEMNLSSRINNPIRCIRAPPSLSVHLYASLQPLKIVNLKSILTYFAETQLSVRAHQWPLLYNVALKKKKKKTFY